MPKNIEFLMIPTKTIKILHFFAINLRVPKAHKFMIFFCHKFMHIFIHIFIYIFIYIFMHIFIHIFMPRNIEFFMIPKKIIKKLHFFAINLWVPKAHKFMIIFCHKLMQ